MASGEDEMGVVGQAADETIDQLGPRRTGPYLVGVVEHDAHVDGEVRGDGVGDLRGRILVAARCVERREHGAPEGVTVDVAGRTGVPHIDAARLDGIGAHGLGEQRRLPEPGPRLDDGHRVVPARVETAEQAGPAHLVGERQRQAGKTETGGGVHQGYRAAMGTP